MILASVSVARIAGFLLDQTQEQDISDVAPDRKFARARFHCCRQAWARDLSEFPMMAMARLQGQGILQWREGGLYENSYVRDGDIWRVKRLDYRPIWQADCALGRSCARPGCLPPFATTYRENPTRPDKLIKTKKKLSPDTDLASFHYPPPVTGKLWKAQS